jgi:hypothetical protein
MQDNKDMVEQRIWSTLNQLLEVEGALDDSRASNTQVPPGVIEFERYCVRPVSGDAFTSNNRLGLLR